jgi:pimeloyl-ACP methyl ester carboxylesterase
VAYRSLRNTPTGGGTPVEGDSVAILAIPEHPLAGAPLVVFAHGSVGIAPKCAPSLLDLSGPASDQDYPISIMRLAGYGFTVIAPDYAGYSYNQAPVGYFNAEDEGHGVLDATRAAANLLTTMPNKVVFVGHSQGGHGALSAQSLAKSYGMKGTLAGVALFAPLWTSMSLWAAGTTSAGMLSTDADFVSVLYTMEYNYSAGELRDPGHGKDVFQAAKAQAAVDAMYAGECYDKPRVMALGAATTDFYDPTFVNNAGFACAADTFSPMPDCSMAPAPTWKTRWAEDRPPIDDQSAPILIWFGGMDTTVKPGWAGCARDTLNGNLTSGGATTTIQYCYDADAQHRDIIRRAPGDYVNQWIAARAGVGTDPAPCTPFPSTQACSEPFNNF